MLYGLGGLYGSNYLYGAGGLSSLYGLNGLYDNFPGQAASLYPAASYAKFSDALQKAAGERLEKTITDMEKDPSYHKEMLEMLRKVGLQVLGGSTGEAGGKGTSARSSASVSDSRKAQGKERFLQESGTARTHWQRARGGSLADRLAANRAGRLAERTTRRQEGSI